jgi:hypothetical protein
MRNRLPGVLKQEDHQNQPYAFAVVLGGTNDLGDSNAKFKPFILLKKFLEGEPASQILANLQYLYDQCKPARVVAVTLPKVYLIILYQCVIRTDNAQVRDPPRWHSELRSAVNDLIRFLCTSHLFLKPKFY